MQDTDKNQMTTRVTENSSIELVEKILYERTGNAIKIDEKAYREEEERDAFAVAYKKCTASIPAMQ